MIRIPIIADNSHLSYFFFYPLYVVRRMLKNYALSCTFSNHPECFRGEGDVLMLDSKCFRHMWHQPEKIFTLLREYRHRVNKIIWLDTTDSTGIVQPDIFPYVDTYLKKQVLRDKNLYTKSFYNTRIYSDYYQKLFNLPDDGAESKRAIPKEDISKIGLTWNLGTGPYERNKYKMNAARLMPGPLKKYVPFKYNIHFVKLKPETRNIKISYRGSTKYSNLAQSIQRLKILEMTEKMNVDTRVIPFKEYTNEIRRAKVGISPFGAGEVCLRDFELIINGAVMLKPDMSHLETWPDIYRPRETYIPFKWDLSDLKNMIEDVIDNYPDFYQVVRKAQEIYAHFLSDKGQVEFCDRFANLVKA